MKLAYPQYKITHPLLDDLADGLSRVFSEDELLGFYLGGSIAIGGFNPVSSDFDFVIVAASAVTDQQFGALQAMHAYIRGTNKNRLYRKHEGVYLTGLQAQHPSIGIDAPHLGRDGQFAVEQHGYELLIDLWKVRQGFVVFGAPPAEVIGTITTDEMIAAKVALFKDWWLPKLNRLEPMGDAYQAYAVLTMARILYGISQHDEVSKRLSAEWLAEVHPQFEKLLHAAVNWREGVPFESQSQVYELMSFVRDRIEEAKLD